MAVELPIVADVPHFDFAVELDGVSYLIELAWNLRDLAWYLTLKTAEGEHLVSGRKLVVDMPAWNRFKDPRVPPGVLLAVDTAGSLEDPGLEDLGIGRRVRLIYTPASEL